MSQIIVAHRGPTSEKFVKKDSSTIEYTITIPPDGEKVITYTAHYWW
ncbi:hypothetical protein [Armatimonas sp.]|nr:hypothetical protein [Armatimonas sp.]